MKKRMLLLSLGVMTAALISGCSSSSKGPYSDYVTLGEYKGLEVTKIKAEVTDETLNDEIDYVLEENTEYNEVDRAAKSGDLVNITFTGTIDGEVSEDASAEDLDMEIGAGDFLEDFENSAIGMKAGENKTFSTTFPDDYLDDTMAGKEVSFDLTVNSVSEINRPELTDEFVSTISEYQTVDEYKEGLRQELLEMMEADNNYTAGSDALSMVIENSTFDGYPDDLYEECEALYNESNQYYAELLGIDVSELEVSEEETQEIVEGIVNEEMVIQTIAAAEDLEVSDEEYTSYVTSHLADYDCDSVEEYESLYSKEDTMDEILREKVQNFLLDNATITEVSEDEYYGYSDSSYSGEDSYYGESTYDGEDSYSGESTYDGEDSYSGESTYDGEDSYSGESTYDGEDSYSGESTYDGEDSTGAETDLVLDVDSGETEESET